MMPVDLVIVPKNMKNDIGQRYVQLLHQTEKYRTVTSKQCNGDKFKKCPYTATLVWSIFAKIDKSNIAVIGAVIGHIVLTFVIFHAFWPKYHGQELNMFWHVCVLHVLLGMSILLQIT